MKKLLKIVSTLLIGTAIVSTIGYAENFEIEGAPQTDTQHVQASPEELQKETEIKAYHQARLEAKKEKIRARMEARGIDSYRIEDPNISEEE